MTVAVVFPGQGSHRAGMAAAWGEHPAGATFDEVGRACGLPDLARLADDPAACAGTALAQPAMFAAGLAAWRALADLGIEPVAVAGHSLGEYTAAVAAGSLSLSDGAQLVGERARAFADACARTAGTMAAILGLDRGEVEAAVADIDDVVVANDNAPGQVVIAGPPAAVTTAVDACRDRGARVRELDVEGAFHTAAMAPAVVRVDRLLRRLDVFDPSVPLVSGANAELATAADAVRRGLVDGVLSPVRWREVQQRLVGLGATTLIEAGPGGVLRGLARRTVPELEVVTVGAPADLDAILAEVTFA